MKTLLGVIVLVFAVLIALIFSDSSERPRSSARDFTDQKHPATDPLSDFFDALSSIELPPDSWMDVEAFTIAAAALIIANFSRSIRLSHRLARLMGIAALGWLVWGVSATKASGMVHLIEGGVLLVLLGLLLPEAIKSYHASVLLRRPESRTERIARIATMPAIILVWIFCWLEWIHPPIPMPFIVCAGMLGISAAGCLNLKLHWAQIKRNLG